MLYVSGSPRFGIQTAVSSCTASGQGDNFVVCCLFQKKYRNTVQLHDYYEKSVGLFDVTC